MKVACPLFRVAGPEEPPSTVNATLPVGMPVPGASVTVAVNVTDWPATDGFELDVTAVAVAALFTVCEKFPVLGRLFASPL